MKYCLYGNDIDDTTNPIEAGLSWLLALDKEEFVGKDAILKNYKIDGKQNSNIKYFYNEIDLDQNSLVENFVLSSGSKFIKNEIICNLKGKYSSAFINGIINLNKSQQHEIKTNINHLAENTKSYQLIKCVLNESSKGIFQGKIFVDFLSNLKRLRIRKKILKQL